MLTLSLLQPSAALITWSHLSNNTATHPHSRPITLPLSSESMASLPLVYLHTSFHLPIITQHSYMSLRQHHQLTPPSPESGLQRRTDWLQLWADSFQSFFSSIERPRMLRQSFNIMSASRQPCGINVCPSWFKWHHKDCNLLKKSFTESSVCIRTMVKLNFGFGPDTTKL